MKKTCAFLLILLACFSAGFRNADNYSAFYFQELNQFRKGQEQLLALISTSDLGNRESIGSLRQEIHQRRIALKKIDFWLRYLEPTVHKRINGPLPVEWEKEVFEKYEKPYKRLGGGLSLAEEYLDETGVSKDSLQFLIDVSVKAMDTYLADSITAELKKPANLYYTNRLFLLNLSAIYTTGFECPDTSRVIPELKSMLPAVAEIYQSYNRSFPQTALQASFLKRYGEMIDFVNRQPDLFSLFDHFIFIRDFVNPLFIMNQQMILNYGLYSQSLNDYALNDSAMSIFEKSLYRAQYGKGIYSLVEDKQVLEDIRQTGKLLFYDPLLSGNNKRSCASCHNPLAYFTDTSVTTALRFDNVSHLPRNTPTLLNAEFNHLLMLDGNELTLQSQARAVIENPHEMNSHSAELVAKLMECKIYADAFKRYLPLTPEEKKPGLDQIISSITTYYSSFSRFYSPFDEAIQGSSEIDIQVKNGFNIFMSKAQCGTCHFPPQFNGVKPPYVGTEFEVLGVPEDTAYTRISADSGRFMVNPAIETMHAFRTGSIRNSSFTKPYMHNGVFSSLEQVIEFYDKGGGIGHKLKVSNQTLSSEPLKLSEEEKRDLLLFMKSLDENITFEQPPKTLPTSANKALNKRNPGGEY